MRIIINLHIREKYHLTSINSCSFSKALNQFWLGIRMTWMWPGCDLVVTWMWPGCDLVMLVSRPMYVFVSNTSRCSSFMPKCVVASVGNLFATCESVGSDSTLELEHIKDFGQVRLCNIAKPATMWNKHYHSFDFKQPASRNWRHNKQVTTADFEQPPWSILNFRFCCHWFDVPLRPSPLISMLRRQLCFTFCLCVLFWPRADPTLNSGGGGGARNLRLSIDHSWQTSNLKIWIQNREQQCYNWPIWVGAAWLKQD